MGRQKGGKDSFKQARVRVRGICQRYGLVWDRTVLRSSGERDGSLWVRPHCTPKFPS